MIYIKILLGLLLLCLCFGAFLSAFVFVIDVIKWHDKETDVKVTPSLQKVLDDISQAPEYDEESEVISDAESGERDSSAILRAWSESRLHSDTEV